VKATAYQWQRRGLFGAATIANAPGSLVDIFHPQHLALGFSLWSTAPFNGPVLGPIIGGFVYAQLGWRWDNWLALILSAASVVGLATVKETYGPVILRKQAADKRKEGDERWWCRYDDKTSLWVQLKVNLSRPFLLAVKEPILWFFNVWFVYFHRGLLKFKREICPSYINLTRCAQGIYSIRHLVSRFRRIPDRLPAIPGLESWHIGTGLCGNWHRDYDCYMP